MSKRVSKIIFMCIGLLILAVGSSACQPKATELAQATLPPTATSVPSTSTPMPTATATKEPTTEPTAAPTIVPTATVAQTDQDPTPTAESETEQDKPVPTPTVPWQIPEERETDWAKGEENAGLIIVEYGDYQ